MNWFTPGPTFLRCAGEVGATIDAAAEMTT
jgi:hypothetical protein